MLFKKVLYISYDGINDPLGKAQVLPYLRKISETGIKIFLLSFEKKIIKKTEFNRFNISWQPVRYHRGSILVKLWDMIVGIWLALRVIHAEKIKIVHCRGYFPAFMALCLKNLFRVSYIFDMRGLWVDERVDAGTLKKGGVKYCIAKWIEKKLLLSADKIVVLTYAMKGRLVHLACLKKKAGSIIVIPTCADLELFYPDMSQRAISNPFSGKFVVSYFGSIGTFYNFSAVIDFYKILSRSIKNAYFLVMSNSPVALTRQIIIDKGISVDKFYLNSVSYENVSRWLNLSDVSLIFYNRKYSREGCCPTKLGESLACGVPVVINDGIGDCSSIIKERNIGVIIKDFAEASYIKGVEDLTQVLKNREDVSKRCKFAAEELFSLNSGVQKYLEVYNSLI